MKKINLNEPLNTFLKNNTKKKPVSFHMPGHKYGRFPYASLSNKFSKFDITEIPGADNIQKADGVIKQSLEMISEAYGSKETMFLTNGATQGIHAIVKYASSMGGTLLVSRDCHSSIINASILYEVHLKFIPIEYRAGLPRPVTLKAVEDALSKNKDCSAVILTSPNYYGFTAPIKDIKKFLGLKDILLCVDEAHGAHYAFSGLREISALNSKADIVCHSLHKTMPVFNQGALLHINSNSVDTNKLHGIVAMLGTSSPSYPILASIEKAVFFYKNHGEKLYRRLKKQIDQLKKALENSGIKFIQNDDSSRIVMNITSVCKNGYEAYNKLSELGVVLETCNICCITAIATPSNKKSDFRRLLKGLQSILEDEFETAGEYNYEIPETLPETVVSIHEAFKQNKHYVTPDRASGSICGTIIIPYPPGVPCLYPGEKISIETARYIKLITENGGMVLGLDNGMIPVLE